LNKADTARARAIAVLEHWEGQNVPVDLLLERELRRPFNDPRDGQLCRALVYGTLRWLGYLDWVLARFSKHPLKKMKPLTRQALRTGCYQLLFMDRIPPSAAINETVAILKANTQPRWLTGFVNGVLRRISREHDSLPVPGQPGGQGIEEHDLFSHPRWLYERWCTRLGRERAALVCLANNRAAALSLRLHGVGRDDYIKQLTQAGIVAKKGPYAPQAVILKEYKGLVSELPGYDAGAFQVQDEAAQLATVLMGDLLPAGRYLDGCAGLGGKTTHLAEMLPPDATLLAVEPEQHRYELLGENLRRLGLDGRVETICGRLEDIGAKDKFNGILIDAPCSGLGVIRRHPDIRWNRHEGDLARYQAGQLKLLSRAAGLLEKDGVLVYITCSTEPEENDQVVGKFLAEHADFSVDDGSKYLPEAARSLVDDEGFLRTLPDQGLDGFFGARLINK
jgi:16S rRNA (cytosine967-C5)-methyltransferase